MREREKHVKKLAITLNNKNVHLATTTTTKKRREFPWIYYYNFHQEKKGETTSRGKMKKKIDITIDIFYLNIYF